eukprot:snap_masked-scaffold_4-processed-gene-8.18-mRNA-1 protein AED:1.00 eAED:1.00 QI:0/-1/0/0/-1/1/1/0/1035
MDLNQVLADLKNSSSKSILNKLSELYLYLRENPIVIIQEQKLYELFSAVLKILCKSSGSSKKRKLNPMSFMQKEEEVGLQLVKILLECSEKDQQSLLDEVSTRAYSNSIGPKIFARILFNFFDEPDSTLLQTILLGDGVRQARNFMRRRDDLVSRVFYAQLPNSVNVLAMVEYLCHVWKNEHNIIADHLLIILCNVLLTCMSNGDNSEALSGLCVDVLTLVLSLRVTEHTAMDLETTNLLASKSGKLFTILLLAGGFEEPLGWSHIVKKSFTPAMEKDVFYTIVSKIGVLSERNRYFAALHAIISLSSGLLKARCLKALATVEQDKGELSHLVLNNLDDPSALVRDAVLKLAGNNLCFVLRMLRDNSISVKKRALKIALESLRSTEYGTEQTELILVEVWRQRENYNLHASVVKLVNEIIMDSFLLKDFQEIQIQRRGVSLLGLVSSVQDNNDLLDLLVDQFRSGLKESSLRCLSCYSRFFLNELDLELSDGVADSDARVFLQALSFLARVYPGCMQNHIRAMTQVLKRLRHPAQLDSFLETLMVVLTASPGIISGADEATLELKLIVQKITNSHAFGGNSFVSYATYCYCVLENDKTILQNLMTKFLRDVIPLIKALEISDIAYNTAAQQIVVLSTINRALSAQQLQLNKLPSYQHLYKTDKRLNNLTQVEKVIGPVTFINFNFLLKVLRVSMGKRVNSTLAKGLILAMGLLIEKEPKLLNRKFLFLLYEKTPDAIKPEISNMLRSILQKHDIFIIGEFVSNNMKEILKHDGFLELIEVILRKKLCSNHKLFPRVIALVQTKPALREKLIRLVRRAFQTNSDLAKSFAHSLQSGIILGAKSIRLDAQLQGETPYQPLWSLVKGKSRNLCIEPLISELLNFHRDINLASKRTLAFTLGTLSLEAAEVDYVVLKTNNFLELQADRFKEESEPEEGLMFSSLKKMELFSIVSQLKQHICLQYSRRENTKASSAHRGRQCSSARNGKKNQFILNMSPFFVGTETNIQTENSRCSSEAVRTVLLNFAKSLEKEELGDYE